jgi:hypothetical protein
MRLFCCHWNWNQLFEVVSFLRTFTPILRMYFSRESTVLKNAYELRNVRPSVRPHESAGLPLDGSMKFVVGEFTKICREILELVKIRQNQTLLIKTMYVCCRIHKFVIKFVVKHSVFFTKTILLRFHYKNGYANAPQRYVIRALCVLLLPEWKSLFHHSHSAYEYILWRDGHECKYGAWTIRSLRGEISENTNAVIAYGLNVEALATVRNVPCSDTAARSCPLCSLIIRNTMEKL